MAAAAGAARGADGGQFAIDIAVNVAKRPGQTENVLPEILRRWFGDDAGALGTRHAAWLERDGSVWLRAAYRRPS